MNHFVQRCVRLCGLLVLLSWSGALWAQEKVFDHATTGFDLTGGHDFVPCESCHVNGQFEGTPRECVSCHSINGRFNATPKPIEHIFTSDRCDTCHNTMDWKAVARVDHHEVFGRCLNCHNNILVEGQPANHIPVQNDCVDCHSDLSWQPVQFSHDKVNTDMCLSCHDGFRATGQKVGHINVVPVCGACHSTNSWLPVPSENVDHHFVLGTCKSCHNGVTATGQVPDHPPVDLEEYDCGDCHNTKSFEFSF